MNQLCNQDIHIEIDNIINSILKNQYILEIWVLSFWPLGQETPLLLHGPT